MSNETFLLFLHGVGDGDPLDRWKVALSKGLVRLGYPDLYESGPQVIAPKFSKSLGPGDSWPMPKVTIAPPPDRDAARQTRRNFERRMGAIELRLGRHDGGNANVIQDFAVEVVAQTPPFIQAQNYLKDNGTRALTMRRILDELPQTGRLVIVGHSLGSVIAADLLRRLPVGLEVVGLVTIGSPLASRRFDVDDLRHSLKDPPANLGWWVNFWNGPDPVVANRGVSSVFPWMIDIRVQEGALHNAHFAVNYLSTDIVAAAVGFGLFGSTSKELAVIEKGLEIPLDYAENVTLMALRYAYLMESKLKGDQQDRFSGARRQVQAAAFERVRARNGQVGRPLPTRMAGLAFDLTDVSMPAPVPDRVGPMPSDESVVPFVTLLATNVIQPFEIDVPKDVRREALEDLAIEMGLGRKFAGDTVAAIEDARSALTRGSGGWIKYLALGIGAAAVLVTGGLAFAAVPVGLVGAAAITSALAAFGPGGMIGGLLTAGALITVSTGGIAVGLASPSTSAATVESVVITQLATAILRKRQGLDQDPVIWASLAEVEIELRRQYEQRDEISDPSAPTLKELKRKIELVERAIKYLSDNGLEPTAPDTGE